MNLAQDLLQFLHEQTGYHFQLDDDIWKKGVVADDFSDLLLAYAKKYNVDMDQYLWLFHNNEEGQNIGALFFKSPYSRVKRIAVTPKMLLAFIESGKWKINYPAYQLPEKRWDIVINNGIMILLILFFIGCFIINKFTSN